MQTLANCSPTCSTTIRRFILGLILGLAIQLSRIEEGHLMVVVLNHRFLKRHVGQIAR